MVHMPPIQPDIMALDAIFFKKRSLLAYLMMSLGQRLRKFPQIQFLLLQQTGLGKHNKYRYTGLTMEHLGLDLVITSQVAVALMNAIQSALPLNLLSVWAALGTLAQRTLSDQVQVTHVAHILTDSCVLVL